MKPKKVAHGGDRKSADAKSSYHNDNLISGKKHVIELQKKMGSTELRSFVLKSLQTA